MKKAKGSYKGKYEFPGGKFEDQDKDFNSCVEREIMEELNCKCKVYNLITHDHISPEIFGIEFDLFFFHVELLETDIKLSDEHTDYCWIEFDKVHNINMLELDYKYIDIFKKYFKS